MPQQKFDAMKKTFFTCLTVCLTLLSCSKNGVEGVRSSEDSSRLSHGMIVLGERLNNPYTVENVRDAYTGVYPTRSSSDHSPLVSVVCAVTQLSPTNLVSVTTGDELTDKFHCV